MSNISFTAVDGGYSPEEVDKYIEMLQQEYQNAVAWGEEMEKKLDELKTKTQEQGVYFTIDENNQNEVIGRVFSELTVTVDRVRSDAQKEADEIIAKANEKSRAIVRTAMENSVELRTESDAVMKNLKSISDMISVILSKSSK